jgi:NAD(P)-dependent dehydrogenase (short-subunit alcohol dehydrogenase family)
MTARLLGHTAVVTLDGHRSDAVARRLAAEGARVVVVGADAERGGRLAGAIEADGSPRAAVLCLSDDVGDLDALVELVAELSARTPAPPNVAGGA